MILIWAQGWYLTYHYSSDDLQPPHLRRDALLRSRQNAKDRVAHEMAATSFKEFGLQDANTLEATQTMLESRAVDRFLLNDQEVLCRHLHKEVADWIEDYKRARGPDARR